MPFCSSQKKKRRKDSARPVNRETQSAPPWLTACSRTGRNNGKRSNVDVDPMTRHETTSRTVDHEVVSGWQTSWSNAAGWQRASCMRTARKLQAGNWQAGGGGTVAEAPRVAECKPKPTVCAAGRLERRPHKEVSDGGNAPARAAERKHGEW